ncbi:hypothetical protein SAMN04488038_102245 [Solimonas aquatica]|uniref:SGNH hydrolase-like domain-containing protein, acetyltransferase AlgX n=1 Tax=Solimonas aquatica TaxID=489703 RepID=A0A1H9BVH4_9GAMM|nr:hypothetical protein [Solimonas aquatica]SEP92975.1 hypothetical protein SAMN04488038_102245 [Solimonas aquatica]
MSDLRVENGVLIGSRDELYLAGGAHGMLQYALGELRPKPSSVAAFKENLASRKAICESLGLPYLHLVAPEKYKVYCDDFPVKNALSPVDHYRECGDFVYPDKLLQAVSEGRTYFRNDTHWAPHGQIEIACFLASTFGLQKIPEARQAMLAALAPRRFVGDLGNKLATQPSEDALRLRASPLYSEYENGLAQDNSKPVNDGRLILGLSEHPTAQGRLLIFGSSFLWTSMPYLGYLFKEVVFCRTRFFHPEMIHMVRPDYVVSEMAERYLSQVTPDAEAPPFLLMPYLLNRAPTWPESSIRQLTKALMGGREPAWNLFPRPQAPSS